MPAKPLMLLPVLLLLAGCAEKEPQIRSYVDRSVLHPPAPPMAGGPGGPGAMSPGSVPSANLPPLDLKWDLPAGWTSAPASGFRVATFSVGEGADKLECILSQLGPEAADPVSNITRWIGQIGSAPDAAAVATFCAAMPSFTTRGGWTGRLADLAPFAGKDSMLGAIIPLPDRVLFLKMTAPAERLAVQRAAFEALCQSLR